MRNRNIGMLALAGILCLSGIMTLVSSMADDPTLDSLPALGDSMATSPEQAYLSFMVPRLERLIEEATAVSSLIEERSRNVFALQRYGNQIMALTTDIVEWDDGNEVPGAFVASHGSLVRTATALQGLIGDAQGALRRFDFRGVDDLIPRFDSAVSDARAVRATLPPAADSPP